VRYLAWPGQALGYAVGSQAIAYLGKAKAGERGIPEDSASRAAGHGVSIPLAFLVPPAEVDELLQS